MKDVSRKIEIGVIKPLKINMAEAASPRSYFFSPYLVFYGFIALIITGTLLLMLPVATRGSVNVSPVDALFTATSAVCVTGLVVVDTGTYWSEFGQAIILFLIQTGGFGFMASATLIALVFGRKLGLKERLVVSRSLGLKGFRGLPELIIKMTVFTLIIEAIGAAVFLFYFTQTLPPDKAIWYSVFHSISAFNNAGFDLFGNYLSFTDVHNNVLVLINSAVLIILGGISFIVIYEIVRMRRASLLSLDTRLALSATGILIIAGLLITLITEYANQATLGQQDLSDKLLSSFFHSVTARTAGFTTFSIAFMAPYSLLFTMLLMFIGGVSGSTAGGIKVNTASLIVMSVIKTIQGKEHPGVFNREFSESQIHRAITVVALSLGFIGLIILLLTVFERSDFLSLSFEAVSAFGTVGLSTGITPGLSLTGKILIGISMLVGRLGPLTLVTWLAQQERPEVCRLPADTIRIG